jgi:phospholipase C
VRRLGAAIALLGACAFVPVLPAAANAAVGAPASRSSVQHLVVMTQGGRSFDNYFGSRTGVDGIPVNSCQLRSNLSQPTCVKPRPITAGTKQIPLRTTAATQVASINRGGMNGFVRAQTTRESDGTSVMGYYRPHALPLMNQLADRGVLFDHWFSGVPGGTVANRLFGVTAQPPGDVTEVPASGWRNKPVIFDRLSNVGVSWRINVQN